MYLVASVHQSTLSRWVQQRAKKSHYQSRVFACVSNNRADAVNRLLISFWIGSVTSRTLSSTSNQQSKKINVLWMLCLCQNFTWPLLWKLPGCVIYMQVFELTIVTIIICLSDCSRGRRGWWIVWRWHYTYSATGRNTIRGKLLTCLIASCLYFIYLVYNI